MTLTFLGGGNMASALVGGWLARGGAVSDVHVIEPDAAQRVRLTARFPGVSLASAPNERVAASTVVVLAVKPQQLRDALRPLVPWLGAAGPLILSIAAGIRLGDIARWLNGYDRLVRAMPNTPALIGHGISGVYARPGVDAPGRAAAERILAACGEVVWLEREDMLDAVTAVSGSGPAYVFYFLEAFETAAVALGFAAADARRLALATFAGATALALSSELTPAALRAQVTSKGGTTERALASFEDDRVGAAIVSAIKAAAERARELGDAFGQDA